MEVPVCPSAAAAASRLKMWVVSGPSPHARLIQMAVARCIYTSRASLGAGSGLPDASLFTAVGQRTAT